MSVGWGNICCVAFGFRDNERETMTRLPCPNPMCSHVFTPEQVQGAAALLCPLFGTRFQFRPGEAKAQPAKPVKANPAAAARSSGVPLAKPVAAPAAPARSIQSAKA